MRKYRVAFSFADENSEYVLRVAEALRAEGISVFAYTDEEVQAEALGQILNAYLQRIYRDDADYAVLFISKSYTERAWTNEEMKFAQERAIRTKGEYILPARFDDSDVPGLTTTTVYADLRKLNPEEFAKRLVHKLQGTELKPPKRPRISQRTVIRSSLAAALVLIAGAIAGLWWQSRLPPSIAVIAIEGESGAPAWPGVAITELLVSDFGAAMTPRVTLQDDVLRMKGDLQLARGVDLSKEMLQGIRKRLSVRWVIVGSYQYKPRDDPDSTLVGLRLRILDTANGKELAETTRTGSDAQLGKLVSMAAVHLRQQAGLAQLSIEQTVHAAAALPTSVAALQSYSEGLIQLRRHDATAARDHFRAAVAAEKHPLLHFALAEAYAALNVDPLAMEEARKAVGVYGKLSNDQQLQMAARACELARPPDLQKAVELRQRLWTGPANRIEHGLRLAELQISQGEVDAAFLTIAELHERSRRDPKVDLVETRAYQQQSKFDLQKEAAQRAAKHAEAIGATSLVAEARLIQATAHYKLGDRQAMAAAIDDAHARFRAIGDAYGEARALEHEATRLDQILEYGLEHDLLDRALAIHRERGDQFSIARVLLNKGTAFYEQGNTAAALPLYEQALATFETIDAPYSEGVTLNQLGALAFNRGDLETAQTSYERALAQFDRASDVTGRAAVITNIGEVLECRGNLAKALERHNEALEINRAQNDPEGIAYDLFRLGEIHALQGDFVTARARYNEALEKYKAINYPSGVADSYVALASLDIDEGKATVAQESLRNAEAIFRKGELTDHLARALGVTAESLLAQGKRGEALAMANKALAQTPAANLRVRLPIEITLARIRATSGKREDRNAALQSLGKTIAEAKRSFFVICELEARLAAAEIEKAAEAPDARRKLDALAAEARQMGFGRIALRASRA